MVTFAAHHAVDEYKRSSSHLPRVRTQDPPQGKTARSKLPQTLSYVLQGPSNPVAIIVPLTPPYPEPRSSNGANRIIPHL